MKAIPILLALTTASAFSQGPLTPPGAPAPMMKTLDQVEPRIPINATNTPGNPSILFIISQPGSYYLTGNITGVAGKKGIVILASGVTLDLNGFTMSGGSVGDDAIYSQGTNNVTIRNGSIDGWVKEGLDLFGINNVRLDSLTVRNSTNGFGIITGNAAMVRDCVVTGSGAGFILAANAVIERCTAQSNTGLGFQLGTGSVATSCASRSNAGNGFFVDSFCTISQCAISGNTASGVEIFQGVFSEGVRVERCTISENQLDGIRQLLGVDCTFADNTLTRNWKCAIRLKDGNHVTRNHISNNGATSGPAEGGVVAAGAGNIIDGNAMVSNAPASVTITAAANRTGVIRNTFTGGTAITDLGVASVIGATTAGPGIVASTNTLTNVQY